MNYFLNFLLQNIKLNFNCDLEVLNMAKRGAGSELNHDNWDQEEESEEAGEFKKASEDQMKVCGYMIVNSILKFVNLGPSCKES